MTRYTRRSFLQHTSAVGATAFSPFALNLAAIAKASAATGPADYKALVCIFMYGGNDAYNTVLATDPLSWGRYLAARGQVALTTPLRRIVPDTPQAGRSFALHTQLEKLQRLYAEGRLAIVANVGPLARPLSKAEYTSGSPSLPPKLFSHNDQQSVWQTMGTEDVQAHGWGGKMVLQARGGGDPRFLSIATRENAAWLHAKVGAGASDGYQIARTGAIRIGSNQAFGGSDESQTAMQALIDVMSSARGSSKLQADLASVVGRSVAAEARLATVMPSAGAYPWGTPPVAGAAYDAHADPLLRYWDPVEKASRYNPLAHQLQAIARQIAARDALGMARQVFMAGLEGLDTHDGQLPRHAAALARLAHAMDYFDHVLRCMPGGVDSMVTTFTASDFGRAFAANVDGTDHGWGGHHFVLGGAVKGRDIYGRFPAYGARVEGLGYDSPDQVGQTGVLLPQIAVEQYAATLGLWMGLGQAQLQEILPALRQHWTAASEYDLGFMKAASTPSCPVA